MGNTVATPQHTPQVQQSQVQNLQNNSTAQQNAVPAIDTPYMKMRKNIMSGGDPSAKRFAIFKTRLNIGFPSSTEFDDATNTTYSSKPEELKVVMTLLDALNLTSKNIDVGILANIRHTLGLYLNSAQAQKKDTDYQRRAASVQYFMEYIDSYMATKLSDEKKEEGQKELTETSDSITKIKETADEKKYLAKRAVQKNALRASWTTWENGLPIVKEFKTYISVSAVNKSDASQDKIIDLIKRIAAKRAAVNVENIEHYEKEIINLADYYLDTPKAKKNDSDWQRRAAAIEILKEKIEDQQKRQSQQPVSKEESDSAAKMQEDAIKTKRAELLAKGENPEAEKTKAIKNLAVFSNLIKKNRVNKLWLPSASDFDKGTNATKITSKPVELNMVMKLLEWVSKDYPNISTEGVELTSFTEADNKKIIAITESIQSFLTKHLKSADAKNYNDDAFQARAAAVELLKQHTTTSPFLFPKTPREDIDSRITALSEKSDAEAKEWIDVLSTEKEADTKKSSITDLNFNFTAVPSEKAFHDAANVGMTAESEEKKKIRKILTGLEKGYKIQSSTSLDEIKNCGDLPHVLLSLKSIDKFANAYLNSPTALKNDQKMQRRRLVFEILQKGIKDTIKTLSADVSEEELGKIEEQDIDKFNQQREALKKRGEILGRSTVKLKNAENFKKAIDGKKFPTSVDFAAAIKTSKWNSYGETSKITPFLKEMETKFPDLFDLSTGTIDDSMKKNESMKKDATLFKNVEAIHNFLEAYLNSPDALEVGNGYQERAAVAMLFLNFIKETKTHFTITKEEIDKEQSEKLSKIEEDKEKSLNDQRSEVDKKIDKKAGTKNQKGELTDEAKHYEALKKLKSADVTQMLDVTHFESATYIGKTASTTEPKKGIVDILKKTKEDTPEIFGTAITALKSHEKFNTTQGVDKDRVKATLRKLNRRSIVIGQWAKKYKSLPEANIERAKTEIDPKRKNELQAEDEKYYRRYLAFDAVQTHTDNFQKKAEEAMKESSLGMSEKEIDRAKDIAEDDGLHADAKKLSLKYDYYEANPIITSIYSRLGSMVEDEGSTATIEAEVKIPIAGAFYLGGQLKVEAERGGEEELETRMELGLKVGATIGVADVSAGIGGYIEAAAKNPNQLAKLTSYGFYRRCQQAGGIIGRFADAIWGGKGSATETMALIENEVLKDNENAYVEIGAYGKLAGELGIGDAAKIEGELKGTSGYRYDKDTMLSDEDTIGNKGKSTIGGSVKVGGQFAYGMGVAEGEYSYLRDLSNSVSLKNELKLTGKINSFSGADKVKAVYEFLGFAKEKALTYSDVGIQQTESEINKLRETIKQMKTQTGVEKVIAEYEETHEKLIKEKAEAAKNNEDILEQIDSAAENLVRIKEGGMSKAYRTTNEKADELSNTTTGKVVSEVASYKQAWDDMDSFHESKYTNDNMTRKLYGFDDDTMKDERLTWFEGGNTKEEELENLTKSKDFMQKNKGVVDGLEDIDEKEYEAEVSAYLKEQQELSENKLSDEELKKRSEEKTTELRTKESDETMTKEHEKTNYKSEKWQLDFTMDFKESQAAIDISYLETKGANIGVFSGKIEKTTQFLNMSFGKSGFSIKPNPKEVFGDIKKIGSNIKQRYN